MSLRDQIQSVYDNEGRLTPALVVAAARPKSHPLHDHFEWSNQIAGEKYRLIQARELIASVKVVYREPDENDDGRAARVWHSVRDQQGYAYQPADEIAKDPVAAELVLRDAEREWRQMYRRYRHLQEFFTMIRQDLDKEGEEAA